MGTVITRTELPGDRLQRMCDQVLTPEGRSFAGCAIKDGDTVHLYYRPDDKCARLHEECHALEGAKHTPEYNRAVLAGDPMPYCPRNLLED